MRRCEHNSNFGVPTAHGHATGGVCSETYVSWSAMVQRCGNSNCPSYHQYGARGIIVCDRWRESFENFLADMGERPRGMSLDRINNDGCYEPSNCRWATPKDQAANTRNAVLLTFGGETHPIAEWGRKTGIGRSTIQFRIKRGWPVESALTVPPGSTQTPLRGSSHGMSKLNERKVLRILEMVRGGSRVVDIAAEYGVSRDTVYRLASGRIWKHVSRSCDCEVVN